MSAENRLAVAALIRELPYCRNRLRDNIGYNAWGVACEAYRRSTGRGRWIRDDLIGWKFVVPGVGPRKYIPPDAVIVWLGVPFTSDSADRRCLSISSDYGSEPAAKYLESYSPL